MEIGCLSNKNKIGKLGGKMGINFRDRKNTIRKIRNMKRKNYMELSIDDKIILFELEEDLEGNKKSCTYYESKGEKRRRERRTKRRREYRGKK